MPDSILPRINNHLPGLALPLLLVLLVLLVLSGCLSRQAASSAPIVFISGDKAAQVRQDFALDRVVFKPLPFAAPNPPIPVYVRGSHNHDGAILTQLKAYFGGRLAVYPGIYRNHRYIEHSALYLPASAGQTTRVFAGPCGEDYAVELKQTGERLTVALDRWRDDPPSWQGIYRASGQVVWQQGTAHFVAETITPAAADVSSLPVPADLRFELSITPTGGAGYQSLDLLNASDSRLNNCRVSTGIPRKPPADARPLR